MESKYRHSNTNVNTMNYHFVFCSKYRRKVFKLYGVEKRFKQLVYEKCKELNYYVIAIECDINHCHLFINCDVSVEPSEVMRRIKGYTSKVLREEFEPLKRLPSLWTRSYYVGTAGAVAGDTIKKYIANQKVKRKEKEENQV